MKRAVANISATVAALALAAACGGSTGTVAQSEAGAVDATSGSSAASSSGLSGSSSSGSSSAGGGSGGSSGGSGAGSSGSGSSGSASGSTSGSSGGGSNSSGSGSGSGSDAGGFACGPYSCDVAIEFCFESGGGAALPDGGSNFTYACNPIPPQCQPDPTCPCVVAADAGTHGCPCSIQPGGALVAACLYP